MLLAQLSGLSAGRGQAGASATPSEVLWSSGTPRLISWRAQKADPEPFTLKDCLGARTEPNHPLISKVDFSDDILRGSLLVFEESWAGIRISGTVFSSFADVLCVLGKVAFLLWALVNHLYS